MQPPVRRPARPRRRAVVSPDLGPRLDGLYDAFNAPDSATDPIQLVRRFDRADDLEIAAFCAAALAFGRVGSVLQSVGRLFALMGDHPSVYVRGFRPERERSRFRGFVHRWTREDDVVALLWLLRQMLEEAGSIEGFFAEGHAPDAVDIGPGLESFSARALALDLSAAYARPPKGPGVAYFFSRPSKGGACKRLNLFLRWMVRRDALDLGVWSRVSPAQLVVPLDTHIIRLGRCLRLTRQASPGWRMAQDITGALRALDPVDPIKYDFALCHLGMMNACGFDQTAKDAHCPLKGLCRPGAPRRRATR